MSNPRLLLVDDEDGLRITLAAILEMDGFEVIEASSAEAAMELLRTEQFDVVLSDVRMPGRRGVELLHHVQSTAQTPMVLMTGFADEADLDEAVRSGVFTVLSKPLDVDNVAPILSRALSGPAVLVVDDAENDGIATAAALEACGLTAKAVHSGEEALALVEKGEVDVCVTDIVMPGMDGVEVAKNIRAMGTGVHVIVFSGQDVPELLHAAAAGGAFRCLRKPLDPEQLARTIATARGTGEGNP